MGLVYGHNICASKLVHITTTTITIMYLYACSQSFDVYSVVIVWTIKVHRRVRGGNLTACLKLLNNKCNWLLNMLQRQLLFSDPRQMSN